MVEGPPKAISCNFPNLRNQIGFHSYPYYRYAIMIQQIRSNIVLFDKMALLPARTIIDNNQGDYLWPGMILISVEQLTISRSKINGYPKHSAVSGRTKLVTIKSINILW